MNQTTHLIVLIQKNYIKLRFDKNILLRFSRQIVSDDAMKNNQTYSNQTYSNQIYYI
jgi:hypothetical protein